MRLETQGTGSVLTAERSEVKRLLAATTIVLAMVTTAYAGCTDEAYSEEKENACNHGYNSAAFEKICPGMTVGNAELRAKLDAKYRNHPKMKKYFKEYYDLNAERADHKDKLTGVMTMCFTANNNAKWIKWDKAVRDQLVADEKQYRARKETERQERLDRFYGKSN